MAGKTQSAIVQRESPTATHIPAASRLLTPAEVAHVTGLSVETLAQWRSQKRGMPYVKISHNCVRYRQCDLDGWLSERIVRTDQDASDRR